MRCVPPPEQLQAESTVASVSALLRAHEGYRAGCLNLIASENVLSPAVASALAGDLESRYRDYVGVDPIARQYRGGRFPVEIRGLFLRLVSAALGPVPYVLP